MRMITTTSCLTTLVLNWSWSSGRVCNAHYVSGDLLLFFFSLICFFVSVHLFSLNLSVFIRITWLWFEADHFAGNQVTMYQQWKGEEKKKRSRRDLGHFPDSENQKQRWRWEFLLCSPFWALGERQKNPRHSKQFQNVFSKACLWPWQAGFFGEKLLLVS